MTGDDRIQASGICGGKKLRLTGPPGRVEADGVRGGSGVLTAPEERGLGSAEGAGDALVGGGFGAALSASRDQPGFVGGNDQVHPVAGV